MARKTTASLSCTTNYLGYIHFIRDILLIELFPNQSR